MSTLTPIKYIGKRPTYIDGMYGTHTAFVQGETVMVDSDIAAKMLRHPDQYELGKAKGAAPAVEPTAEKPVKEDEATQDLRDQINIMDKDSLETFAKNHFRIDLDKRKSVSSLREAVTRVDREMCAIRDAGKLKARERIAVLSALNLAFELVSAPQGAVSSSAPDGASAPQVSDSALGHLIDRLDAALKDDGHLL